MATMCCLPLSIILSYFIFFCLWELCCWVKTIKSHVCLWFIALCIWMCDCARKCQYLFCYFSVLSLMRVLSKAKCGVLLRESHEFYLVVLLSSWVLVLMVLLAEHGVQTLDRCHNLYFTWSFLIVYQRNLI